MNVNSPNVIISSFFITLLSEYVICYFSVSPLTKTINKEILTHTFCWYAAKFLFKVKSANYSSHHLKA